MAGRRSRNVEFIQLLAELLELDGAEFAHRIGKKTPNVNAYTSGKLVPGKRVLLSALRHAFEWGVTPVAEVRPVDEIAKSLPESWRVLLI